MLKGAVQCKSSGAWLFPPTPEQIRQDKLEALLKSMYEVMPDSQKKKIPEHILEVIK